MKLLIADDEEIVLETLTSILPWEEYGIDKILCANNGADAFNLYLAEKPDILITDLKMPQMSGIELITKIREIDESIHILILSAYTDFEDARQAISLNVIDYLLKPLNFSKFEEQIRKISQSIENVTKELQTPGTGFGETVNKIIAYIEQNYKNPNITLMDVSKHFYIDYYYLSRLFKKETGKLFSQYLRDLRIEQAKKLRQTTDLKIYEIAKETGFNNIRTFRKQFKDVTGEVPSEFSDIDDQN